MYLHALATQVPAAAYTQAECWDIIARSEARQRLQKRSRLILHSILKSDSGIARRHFAVPGIDGIFDLTSDQLNAAFRAEAPALAERALRLALQRAGLRPETLDALLICTCTGYLCPGLTSYVAERLGLRSDAILQDFVGLGCGAAIPTLRAVSHLLAARPEATVACVAVEICSAAFYLDDDPGVLISACLFGDGAAATIWRAQPAASGLRCSGFQTLHLPEERDKLRFETRDGKLRNLLHETVPALAASAVRRLWDERAPGAIARIVAHPGGRDVLDALEAALPGHRLEASRSVLRERGNMSSPSVLFALESALQEAPPNGAGDFWLVSFGAGFSAHACRLSRG